MDIINIANDKHLNSRPITDYLRFFHKVWPLADSSLSVEDKYFNQIYVTLSQKQITQFSQLLKMGSNDDWNYEQLIRSLRTSLPEHTTILKNDEDLANLAAKHTDAALKIKTLDGINFNKMLIGIQLNAPLVVFRTLNRDYYPPIEIGDHKTTEDIWSTSYDPLSSMGFGLSDPDLDFISILRLELPSGFVGAFYKKIISIRQSKSNMNTHLLAHVSM